MRHETTETPPTTPEPATATTRSTTATADRSTERGFTPFSDDERGDARRRWEDIEARFVDDPAGATEAADEFLADTMERMVSRWDDHRSGLRDAWTDDGATTEHLRTTLKRYRAALDSLLSG